MPNPIIPLSLYIHIPWCIKKCPYCDFNSHPQRGALPENNYIDRLIEDLKNQLAYVQNRKLTSIFIGGGTPSLFSPEAYDALFSRIRDLIDIPENTEITLEANPGTIVPNRFEGYRKIGINRVSIGVQSFQDDKLKTLGRIHNHDHAKNAIIAAQKAGFDNFNIDLMFGLPDQTIQDAVFDLETAIALSPTHLSWYQLTLEPNTLFHRFPPTLPSDDERFEIQEAGQALLAKENFKQYEVSAYARNNQSCKHNLNYWRFGDYIGIGAGAHGKTTHLQTMQIERHWNQKHPKQYLSCAVDQITESAPISQKDLPLEFMMNALRLHQPIPFVLFESRTGLAIQTIQTQLTEAKNLGFLTLNDNGLTLTHHGKLFLNDLLALF